MAHQSLVGHTSASLECLLVYRDFRRRGDLLELLDGLNPTIAKLTQAIDLEVEKCPATQRLITHPGVRHRRHSPSC